MPQDPGRRRYRRFFGTDPRRDVDEELSFHLAMSADEYRAEGLSADDAMARARSRFGDVDQIHRECDVLSSARASRVERARRLEALRHDVVAAARALRGDRAFALGVAMTLALGIGATAAVFSVAYGVLLRPLPFPHAEQLVRLWSRKAARNLDFFSVSPADFKSWRSEGGGFAAMSAFERQRSAALGRGDGTEVIQISAVTADIFPLLGTRPILGRSLIADDARPDAPAVAVIGYAVWASRFGADSALVGGAISLDGRPVRVVGVMPPRFFVPGSGAELWLPLSLDSASI